MTRTLKLTLAYDGTDFVGWQRQPDGRSVQGLLEEALARVDKAPVAVIGAGRTDAGVHATGQVASARVTNDLPPETLMRALNATLPRDLRVLRIDEAPATFDARREAKLKTYEYRLAQGAAASPFTRRFCWHVPGPLDLDAMREAARRITGRHDFSSFRSTGSSVTTSTRTVTESRLEWTGAEAGTWWPVFRDPALVLIRYGITGDGFLRYMVRTIVGTLVEVGKGALRPEEMSRVIEARDRGRAGPTAPAAGLCLVEVRYG